MRALTVQQPWCSAIVAGRKPLENRPRAMGAQEGEWIALHAGLSWHPLASWCRDLWPDCPTREEAPMGAILGLVLLGPILPRSVALEDPALAPWVYMGPVAPDRPEPVCLTIRQAIPLVAPVPCRGALGLWTVPEHLLPRLRLRFVA